ncbi:hypothetical protein BGX24_007659, partial [Mortierella sp. AD032]
MSSARCVDEALLAQCRCTEMAMMCGDTLDKTLCAEVLRVTGDNGVYVCAGAGATPVMYEACSTRTTCIMSNKLPTCGTTSCVCSSTKKLCGSTFAPGCGLETNSIYTCNSTDSAVKSEACSADEECVTLTAGAACASKECKCTTDGVVCGKSFSSTCGFVATSLYDCKINEAPTIKEDCAPGTCASTAPAAE